MRNVRHNHNPKNHERKEEDEYQFSEILTRSTILPQLATLDAGDVIECYVVVRNAKLQNVHGGNNNNNKNISKNNNSKNDQSSSNSSSSSEEEGGGGGGGGGGSSGGQSYIEVQKSAIAFRYKPKSSSPDAIGKTPFELTLEYGPQRIGATQEFEAMPHVNGHGRRRASEHDDYYELNEFDADNGHLHNFSENHRVKDGTSHSNWDGKKGDLPHLPSSDYRDLKFIGDGGYVSWENHGKLPGCLLP